MPEPITLSIIAAASQVAGPTLNGLATLTKALKEPGGRKKIEEMRQELATTFDGIKDVIHTFEQALEAVKAELVEQERLQEQMRKELDYLKLPFWKRWFTPKPIQVLRATGG